MGILINKNTRILVQGITGQEGRFHTEEMLKYGSKVVAGVTPGKKGERVMDVPVFNTVKEAVDETQPTASVIFVPSPFVKDALLEAIFAGIKLIVCITEGVPVKDFVKVKRYARDKGVIIIGPNCPGLITPGECKLGIMPAMPFTPGNIGIISRSGTLTYQVADELTRAGYGQTTVVGIGGDPVVGSTFLDILPLFASDEKTKAVVLMGEIGGSQEEKAAEYLKNSRLKAVAFIAGRSAPEGKKMGHAGAIVSGKTGTAQAKIEAFAHAGIPVADTTSEVVSFIKRAL